MGGVTGVCADVPVLPDPGEELFSSLLDEEEKPPPDVFSDLSTVLLSMDLGVGVGGGADDAREHRKGMR